MNSTNVLETFFGLFTMGSLFNWVLPMNADMFICFGIINLNVVISDVAACRLIQLSWSSRYFLRDFWGKSDGGLVDAGSTGGLDRCWLIVVS